jgi:hypothetical protein
MQKPPLIDYLPYGGQESEKGGGKTNSRAFVFGAVSKTRDEYPKQSHFGRRLWRSWARTRKRGKTVNGGILWRLRSLAIADDRELQEAVLCFKHHLEQLRMY